AHKKAGLLPASGCHENQSYRFDATAKPKNTVLGNLRTGSLSSKAFCSRTGKSCCTTHYVFAVYVLYRITYVLRIGSSDVTSDSYRLFGPSQFHHAERPSMATTMAVIC